MALNIKNPRVVSLARQAASVMGTTQVGAIEAALENYLQTEAQARRRTELRAALGELHAQLSDETKSAIREAADRMYDDDGVARL